MAAPGDVGERAGGDPQPPVGRASRRGRARRSSARARRRTPAPGRPPCRRSARPRPADRDSARPRSAGRTASPRAGPSAENTTRSGSSRLSRRSSTRAAAGKVASRRAGTPGCAASSIRRQAPQPLGEAARCSGVEGVAVHHPHRHPGSPPCAPWRSPGSRRRPRRRPGSAIRAGGRRSVNSASSRRRAPRPAAASMACTGKAPERQADVALADPVVEHLDHLEAAAAHVADEAGRPVEARDHAETGEAGLLGAAEDPHLEARQRRRSRRPAPRRCWPCAPPRSRARRCAPPPSRR